jgi:hypothetical protein
VREGVHTCNPSYSRSEYKRISIQGQSRKKRKTVSLKKIIIIPIIPATGEVELGESWSKASKGKSARPYLKTS